MKSILLQERISVLSLQETEIENSYNKNILRIPRFNLELETNTRMSRTGFYIANDINYTRKLTLEGVDSNLIINYHGLTSPMSHSNSNVKNYL